MNITRIGYGFIIKEFKVQSQGQSDLILVYDKHKPHVQMFSTFELSQKYKDYEQYLNLITGNLS